MPSFRYSRGSPSNHNVGKTVIKKVKLEKGYKTTDWTPAPEDMATVTQVSILENTVDGLNHTVAGYETELLGYRGDVTQYQNQVSTMTNTDNGFNNTVAQYTTEVDEMGNEVDAYATQVSTLENTVNGTVTRVGNAEGKITTIETNVSGLQTTVASKAAQSQVTQLSNSLTSTITEVEGNSTQISQNATNINLRVKEGDVISQINGEADRTLISSSKILLNADTVSISGTAWMSGAVIKNATIDSAKIASLDASKISAGTLNGFIITNPFNYSYDGAIRNQGNMTMKEGQLIMNGVFTHSHGKTYTYLNADSLYSENIMSNGSVRSMYKLDGNGLTVQKLTSRAHYRQDGIHFTDGGTASIKYYDDNARIEIGSYNGVSLGANSTGTFFNRLSVGGGADNVDPFVDIYTKLNMRFNFIDNVPYMYLRNSGAPLSGSVLANTSDNWLEMAGRWGTRLGHRSEDNASFHVRAEFTTNDIKFYTNLNMQNNTIINNSDERLKKDIVYDETNSLDAIKSWRIAGFNWRDPEATTERQFGVIAQTTPEIASMGDKGYLNVNSSKQLQMVTHAVQQLEKRESNNNKTNEEKIHQLQQELSKTNRIIEELKNYKE